MHAALIVFISCACANSSSKALGDWEELQEIDSTILYKNKSTQMLQRENPGDAEFLEAIYRFKVRKEVACQKQNSKQRQLQEEEANGNWGLFAFAYNQWLSKASIMIMKRNEPQDSQFQIVGRSAPEDMTDDMTDQVSKTHARHINVRHMNSEAETITFHSISHSSCCETR
jgi:hypothetical protein